MKLKGGGDIYTYTFMLYRKQWYIQLCNEQESVSPALQFYIRLYHGFRGILCNITASTRQSNNKSKKDFRY